jgi:hypothetical protein
MSHVGCKVSCILFPHIFLSKLSHQAELTVACPLHTYILFLSIKRRRNRYRSFEILRNSETSWVWFGGSYTHLSWQCILFSSVPVPADQDSELWSGVKDSLFFFQYLSIIFFSIPIYFFFNIFYPYLPSCPKVQKK